MRSTRLSGVGGRGGVALGVLLVCASASPGGGAVKPGPLEVIEFHHVEDRLEVEFTATVPAGPPPAGRPKNEVKLQLQELAEDAVGRQEDYFEVIVDRHNARSISTQVRDKTMWALQGYFGRSPKEVARVKVDLGRRRVQLSMEGEQKTVETGFLRVPRRGRLSLYKCSECTGEILSFRVISGGGEPWPVRKPPVEGERNLVSPYPKYRSAKSNRFRSRSIRGLLLDRKKAPETEAEALRRSWLGR